MKVLICSICAAASCGMAIASPIGEAIGKHLDGGDLPGAVSVVVDGQGRTTVDCRGYADLAAKVLMRSDTIFWLASNTKAIAAATLMTLVDEGKVKLDDPVSKYLPAFANVTVETKDGARPPARPMTVRMTLSHMSGLPFFPGMPIDKRPISELARLATVTPLAADPGERYAYSNWGIDVAMAVVEQVTGRSFAAVMKERILVPLGMKDAVFIPSEEQVARLAKSYHLDNAKPPEEMKIGQFRYPYTDPTREPEGGGGLFGTADDLCRFFRMLAAGGTAPDGRRILSEQAVREMTRRQTPDRPKIKSYGFGLNVKPDSVEHGGAYGTYAAFDPQTKAVRVLCISMHGKNKRRSAFWSAWGKAVDAYLGKGGGETFTNPVIAADWPDPAVWNGGDGWYYSVATGLRTIRRSRNLIDWEDAKIDPLTPRARERLHQVSRHIWAPCVTRLRGQWVLYISLFVSDPDCRIAALTSTSPTGPFEFAGEVIDSRREGVENAIDPYVLEVDGQVWMFFGSLADGIHRIELAADGLSVKPDAKPVHVAGVRHPADKRKRAWEGSYLHWRDGWWYLFVSGGHYGDHTYYLTAGRSRKITGTFVDRQRRPMTEGLAEPILSSGKDDFFYGPGHNGEIVKSADGRDYIFFHSHVRGYKPNERPTLLQELMWDKDGWPSFKDGRPQKTERRFIGGAWGETPR
ncbi:MAG: serine hydrolase [Kiritimatiellae bacterium]|nr:serine hydrolase [Kiritimatiellia bacterium]